MVYSAVVEEESRDGDTVLYESEDIRVVGRSEDLPYLDGLDRLAFLHVECAEVRSLVAALNPPSTDGSPRDPIHCSLEATR